jgi:hypothetical protein
MTARLSSWLALVTLLGTTATAQIIIDFPQSIPIGEPDVVTTVTLRPVELRYEAPNNLLPPLWVQPGTSVRLQLGPAFSTGKPVRWVHDGEQLSNSSTSLVIARVTEQDAGSYGASVDAANTPAITRAVSETITLRVGQPKLQSFLNLSSYVRLTPAQPAATVGFVISDQRKHGVTGKQVLIRAVGPSLGQFGVADPLRAPQFKVFAADGTEIMPLTIAVLPTNNTGDPMAALAKQVGAFPLLANSKDVSRLYTLTPGAYSAQVFSADGSAGTVLLELYELP